MKTFADLQPPAAQVAERIRAGLLDLSGSDVEAIWLYGAAVFGAPYLLDLDIHVLLRRPLKPNEIVAVKAIEEQALSGATGVEDIDSWFILRRDAHLPTPPEDQRWLPERSIRDKHWPLHRAHWLAGAVVVLHGPAPSEVVVPPGWAELRSVLMTELDDAGHHSYDGSAYWTLQLCRILASLETRDVVRSKLDSARWALQRLGEEARPIIEAAERFYRGQAFASDDALIRERFSVFYERAREAIDLAR